MKRKQQTLAAAVELQGTGLHTGVQTRVCLRPAPVDTGWCIHLRTKEGVVDIPISPQTTRDHMHRTVAFSGETMVHTIEHLLAALAGCWVDNVHIDLDAPEPPGGDGSARAYAELLEHVGLVPQAAPVKPAVLREPLTVTDGKGAVISALPHADGLKLTYTVHYPESHLAQGMAECVVSPEVFRKEIASARTFALEAHVARMREAGCGQGASYDNTLVLRTDEVVENELRYPNEPARHKLLDLLGDLAVMGRPLCMHVVALRSGHPLNAAFVAALAKRIARQEHPQGVLDVRAIEATLPHRYPFLLVDRILEVEPGRRIVGLKNVTRNEEFFQGHFPGQPVMPGVLQIEALAQTGGVMMLRETEPGRRRLAVLMSVDGVKHRRPVVPGDQLVMEVLMERAKGRIGQVQAVARVDGEVATQARIKFALVDADDYA